jgi:acyl-CoA thioesterase
MVTSRHGLANGEAAFQHRRQPAGRGEKRREARPDRLREKAARAAPYREDSVTTATTLSPDQLARACADAMWAEDNASRGLGMEIVEIGAGHAVLAMTVKPEMVNGHGIAHGGFIFTLADSAFAFACNSYNERTVAAHGNISFIRPGKLGDRLVADAREISKSGRSGIYDIRVTANGDTVIAELRGHSRTIGGTMVDAATPDKPSSRD